MLASLAFFSSRGTVESTDSRSEPIDAEEDEDDFDDALDDDELDRADEYEFLREFEPVESFTVDAS